MRARRLSTRLAVGLLLLAAAAWGQGQRAPKDQAAERSTLDEGIVPGAFKIPGTDLALKVGGYAKLDFIQDLDAIGNSDQFKTNSIPVPSSGEGGQTRLHARETRLTLDLSSDTPKGKFHVYFEGDFYGVNNNFRTRHAYGELGNLLGGQTWTTFMDISARPRSLDYEGPDSEIFVRQAMIRWTQPLSDHWKLAVAVEEPGAQFGVSPEMSGSPQSNAPDIPVFARYETGRGHFQVAAILRQIRFDGTHGSQDVSTTGWGVNSTFRLKTIGPSSVMGQFVFGEGLGRYIESMSGQNVAAVFRGDELRALPARAAVLAYEQHWNAQLMSTVAGAYAGVSTDASQADSVIRQTRDVRANLIWAPYKMVDIGGEVLWGYRENRDGSSNDAVRLQASLIFKLN